MARKKTAGKAKRAPRRKSCKCNGSQRIYSPPAWAWRLVWAFCDLDVKATVEARCRDAKINKTTYYRERKKPEFVAWFDGMLAQAMMSAMSEVQRAHLRLCQKGDLEAIRLWHEFYGDFIPTRKLITEDLGRLSDRELDQIERLLAPEGLGRADPQVH